MAKKSKIDQIMDISVENISSQRIINYIEIITAFHRIQGSNEYLKGIQTVKEILSRLGVNCKLHSSPADGCTTIWGWKAPFSWNITSGRLWVVNPFKKKIADFSEIPMNVITHSNPANVTGELVDIGEEDNIMSGFQKAKGKIAMITANPRNTFVSAAEHGVKGLIYYPSLEKALKIGSSTVQYDGFWPIDENVSKVTCGFSISYEKALYLKNLLKRHNRVIVQLEIEAKLYKGKLYVLEAIIEGTTKKNEEIIFIAHFCHPAKGANDNASGSAALIEIVSTLNSLIEKGAIARPQRTLKFLWVPEFHGTIPWLERYQNNRDKTGRSIIAVLNLDMIGESPKTIGNPLKISLPSFCTPSYLKATITAITKYFAKNRPLIDHKGIPYELNYQISSFQGGSDHVLFNDLFFTIPSVMFGHDDIFHHTSADNLDKVHPQECKAVSVLATIIGYYIASFEDSDLGNLLHMVFNEILTTISRAVEMLYLIDNPMTLLEFNQLMFLLQKLALKEINSISALIDIQNTQSRKEIEKLFTKVKKIFSDIIGIYGQDKDKMASGDIKTLNNNNLLYKWKRNYSGPTSTRQVYQLDIPTSDSGKRLSKLKEAYWGGIILEFLNLVNGELSGYEIYLLLKFSYPQFEIDDILLLTNLFNEQKIIVRTE